MKRFLLTVFIVTALVLSCRTTDPETLNNLSPGEFFQKAQTAAADYKDYDTALLYYRSFIERFPDEPLMIIEAEYEIAFLYYKKDDNETALKLFNEILDKYSQPEAAMLPAWPEILSKKLIGVIEAERSENEATAEE